MKIDLRSDTVTRPTAAMLAAMQSAQVGDDVFGEDPTIRALEEKSAALFGKEAAVYCPSGTMTNQIAIKVHTRPLEQVICHQLSHIYNYEVGGHAFHSGVSLKLVEGNRGRLQAEDIEKRVNPDLDWLPVTRLVWIENTCNKAGGSYYQLIELERIKDACLKHNLNTHLDGARIFNALVETEVSAAEVGQYFDSISFCLSKGLGAPVGSVLVGDSTFIRKARRVRKVMGGGMRQAGFLAAAGIYALDNNIERLKEDHLRAKKIEEVLIGQKYVKEVFPVDTNILMIQLNEEYSVDWFCEVLAKENIHTIPLGENQVRLVTHLDFTDEMLTVVLKVLNEIA